MLRRVSQALCLVIAPTLLALSPSLGQSHKGAIPSKDAIAAITGATSEILDDPNGMIRQNQRSLPLPDPFPILRKLQSFSSPNGNALPKMHGPMKRMPREEFEAAVQFAAKQQAVQRQPPKLVESHYTARLTSDGLTGNGEWSLVYPAGAGGLVDVSPLGIAIWNPRWSSKPAVVFHNSDSQIGDSTILAMDIREHVLKFEWSADGVSEPQIDRYELSFPSAAISTLDLELKSDREPIVGQNVFVTGPLPGATPEWKRWRIVLGNVTQLNLGIRKIGDAAGVSASIRYDRDVIYQYEPNELKCLAKYDLDMIRNPVETIVFEIDPHLHILDVVQESAQQPHTWYTVKGKSQKDISYLYLQFPDPITSASLSITATSHQPPSVGQSWVLPGMHLPNGISESDKLTLDFDRSMHLETCDPRDYRIVASAPVQNHSYRLSLLGTMSPRANAASKRQMPVISIRADGISYTSKEEVYWRVDANRSSLYARLKVDIEQGPCAQWNFQIPTGYSVQSVEMEPADPGVQWSLGATSRLLTVLPSHAIATGETLELHIELKGSAIFGTSSHEWDSLPMRHIAYPNIILIGAKTRTGTYAIDIGPSLSFTVASRSDSVEQRRKHNNRTIVQYEYSGVIPGGVLHCVRPLADLSVQIESELSVASGENNANVIHRMNVQSPLGMPNDIFLLMPVSDHVSWSVTVQEPIGCDVHRILTREDLNVLTYLRGLSAWGTLTATAMTQFSTFEVWRIRRPNEINHPLVIQAVVSIQEHLPADADVRVPYPIVCGVDPLSYVHHIAPNQRRGFGSLISITHPYPMLSLQRLSPASQSASLVDWKYADLKLLANLQSSGTINCILSGQLIHRAGSVFSVDLPEGSQLHSVSIDGKIVSGMIPNTMHPARLEFLLPADSGAGNVFEVQYQLNTHFKNFCGWVHCPAPILAGGVQVAHTEWSYDSYFVGQNQFIPSWLLRDKAMDSVFVIRFMVLQIVGYMLASMLLGIGLGVLNNRRRSGRVILAAFMMGIGMIAWFAPPHAHPLMFPPLVTGLLLLCGYWVRYQHTSSAFGSTVSYAGHHPVNGRTSHLPVTLLAVGTIILAYQVDGYAQAPTPAVVTFSVSRDAHGDTRWDAIVSQSVWDRLKRLSGPILDTAVITSAEYKGDTSLSNATLEAVFRVFNPTETQRSLIIPLSRARIREISLNAKPVLLDMSGPDRYSVLIRGFGSHTVRVVFEVPVSSVGGEHELRFGIPNVPTSRVALQLPQNVRRPDIVSARGAQTFRNGRIFADLGIGNEFVMKWRGHASDSQAVVTVREASLWDLHESYSRLMSVFHVRIDGGSESEFRIAIPDNLEPGNIVIRPTDPKMVDSQLGLREWRLLPGNPGLRTLYLMLRAPVTGRVTIQLKMYPRVPLSTRPTLHFPRILGVSDVDSYYALRTRDVLIEDVNRVGMIDYPADALTKDFATSSSELELDQFPVMRVFRGVDGPQPRIQPVLRPQGTPLVGSAEIHWDIGSSIRATGVVKSAPSAGVRGWIEFDLPAAVDIQEVRAPDILGWGRTGNRVQVWFQKPVANVVVHWSGQLQHPRYQKGHTVPVPLTLPLPRVGTSSRDTVVTLKVTTSNGWTVEPGETDHLVPHPAPMDGVGDYYLVTQTTPSVPFLGYPPQASGGARIFDLVSQSATSVVYQSTFDIPVRPGRPQTFVVSATGHAPDAVVELRGQSGALLSVLRAQPGDHAWTVRTERHVPSAIRLHFTLRQSAQSELRIPLVALWLGDDPYPVAHRLLVAEGEARMAYPSRLAWDMPETERRRLLKLFPDEASRVMDGRVTHVPSWLSTVRLQALPQTPLPAPAADAVSVPSKDTAAVPAQSEDEDLPTIRLIERVLPGLGLLGWVVGLLCLCFYLPHPAQWPYRLVMCGILGGAALGFLSPTGRFFLAVATFGIVLVMLRVLVRVSAIRR